MHRRHFATIEVAGKPPRQVHYRRAGSGPPVLLLHKSPESSMEFEGHLDAWAQHFTAIALDTPGYGLSDPLPDAHLGLAPFGDGLAAFLDALGIEKACVYGAHTGGLIALEFARRHPSRVSAVVSNGIIVLDEAEKAYIVGGYFGDYTPEHDGRHMTRIWHRVRDQFLFFPWFEKTMTARHRMSRHFDVFPAADLQPALLDLLRTGKHERDGYAAAFNSDAIDILKGIKVPCTVLDDDGSILVDHLERLPKGLTKVERVANQMALEARAREILLAHADQPAPPQTATATIKDHAWKDYAGQMFIRRSHMGRGRPLVLLHDYGASSAQWKPLMAMTHRQRPTIAPDLPGHGETGNLVGEDVTVGGIAKAVTTALQELGVAEYDVVAMGGMGLVALSLPNAASLTLIDFWNLDAATRAKLKGRMAPDLTPVWYGGHMNAAWYAARDAEFFWPWFDTTRAAVVARPAELDLTAIHQRAVDLLKAAPWHGTAVDHALKEDPAALLKRATAPVKFAAQAGSPHAKGDFLTLSDDPARRWAAIAALFRN